MGHAEGGLAGSARLFSRTQTAAEKWRARTTRTKSRSLSVLSIVKWTGSILRNRRLVASIWVSVMQTRRHLCALSDSCNCSSVERAETVSDELTLSSVQLGTRGCNHGSTIGEKDGGGIPRKAQFRD